MDQPRSETVFNNTQYSMMAVHFRRLRLRLLSEIILAIFTTDIFGRFQASTKIYKK